MQHGPYKVDNLHCPKDEGRSLHDEASCFDRNVVKLPTPLANLPKSLDVSQAMKMLGSDSLFELALFGLV
jgi:hypothetical protein